MGSSLRAPMLTFGVCALICCGRSENWLTDGIEAPFVVPAAPPASLIDIQVRPESLTLARGDSAQLIVTGLLDDGSTSDLSSAVAGTIYRSSVPGDVAVDAEGQVKAHHVGDANIVVLHRQFAAEVPVLVIEPSEPPPLPDDLVHIQIENAPTIAYGTSEDVRVSGWTAAGTHVDLSGDPRLEYALRPEAVGRVDGGGRFVAERHASGALLTARLLSLTATTEVQVRPPDSDLVRLFSEPYYSVVNVGLRAQYRLTGMFQGGVEADLSLGTTGTVYVDWTGEVAHGLAQVDDDGVMLGLEPTTMPGTPLGNFAASRPRVGNIHRLYVRVLSGTPDELEVLPERIELGLSGDAVHPRVLAWTDGYVTDVTPMSVGTVYTAPANGIVAVTANGFIVPLAVGSGVLRVSYAGVATSVSIVVQP